MAEGSCGSVDGCVGPWRRSCSAGPYLGDADLLVLGLAAIAAVAAVVVQAARRARL